MTMPVLSLVAIGSLVLNDLILKKQC